MGAGPPLIFLMGPTAAGKSGAALELAACLPCEIVSVDSALIYRGMDIGTAKPSAAVLRAVPHRLIDIRDPAEAYSAAGFRCDALREIAAITAAGRVPLLVGGTMLYFRALEHGLSRLPGADPALRDRISEEARRLGWDALHRRLAAVDPAAAARIHSNDRQRIQRALEVYELQRKSISELQDLNGREALPHRIIKLILAPSERALLHARIAARFERMLEEGFVEEVQGLRARGDLHPELPSMRAVGYRQVWNYLEGSGSYLLMREQAIAATRQFARRQLTWLRAERQTRWFDTGVGFAAGIVDHLKRALD